MTTIIDSEQGHSVKKKLVRHSSVSVESQPSSSALLTLFVIISRNMLITLVVVPLRCIPVHLQVGRAEDRAAGVGATCFPSSPRSGVRSALQTSGRSLLCKAISLLTTAECFRLPCHFHLAFSTERFWSTSHAGLYTASRISLHKWRFWRMKSIEVCGDGAEVW